jgi:hypothetical protein
MICLAIAVAGGSIYLVPCENTLHFRGEHSGNNLEQRKYIYLNIYIYMQGKKSFALSNRTIASTCICHNSVYNVDNNNMWVASCEWIVDWANVIVQSTS